MAERRQTKRDTWSKKIWFKVYAPDMFKKEGVIAETPAFKESQVIDRVVELPLTEVTGNFKHYKYKIYLKIKDVKDNKALTSLHGLELLRDFIARAVRKRTSRVDVIEDFVSKDGVKARYKILAITKRRVKTTTKKDIRKVIKETLKEIVESSTFSEIIEGFLNEAYLRRMMEKANKVYPINYIDISKIEVF